MKYKCKCCGQDTLPALPEDLLAFICPVCMWENDVFIADDAEPSDENHGLTLNEGRENYKRYGICDPRLNEPRKCGAAEASAEIIGGSHRRHTSGTGEIK